MATVHQTSHPKKGETVTISSGDYDGLPFEVEDWWDIISGFTWEEGLKKRHPMCIMYAITFIWKLEDIPKDNEVVVGSIGGHRLLMHDSLIVSLAK